MILNTIAVSLILVSAFTPYFSNLPFYVGLIFVYVCVFFSFVFQNKKIKITYPMNIFLFFLVINFFWIVGITTLNMEKRIMPIELPKIISGFEKNLAPIILLILLSRVSLSFSFIKMYVYLMFVNSIIVLYQTSQNNLTPFILSFYNPPTPNGDLSVSELAAQLGRFSGIFNQPSEAGIAYTVVFFLAIYLIVARARISFFEGGMILVIFLAGFISVSKIFFPLGVGLCLIWSMYLAFSNKRFLLMGSAMFFLIIIVGLISISSGLFSSWRGLDFFLRLFDVSSDSNIVDLFSGGRFGNTNSDTVNYFSFLFENYLFVTGIGVNAFETLDNGLLGILSQGGIFSLIFTLTPFVLLLYFVMKRLKYPEAQFILVLITFIFFASFGGLVILYNRVNIILFLFLFAFTSKIIRLENDGKKS